MNDQIKLKVIQDVQAELDKSKGSAIKRLFTFDRDTDIGRIQIGDRCLSINWKKITRGLLRGKRYANDRIPTLEEVRKIVE